MNSEINRQKLIDYIRQNKPIYREANFSGHSDMQLLLLKVGIEIENRINQTSKDQTAIPIHRDSV